MSIIRIILITLFYPWACALAFRAYELYTQSELYSHRVQFGGTDHATNMYIKHDIVNYWKKAWRQSWLKIIFMPLHFQPHLDLLERKNDK